MPSTWTGVAAGHTHTCGIRPDDQLLCWGGNARGQLGVGDTTRRMSPAVVGTQGDWLMVTTGDFASHTCALKNDGRRYCWGANNRGQLGIDNRTDRLTPGRLAGETGWLSIVVGGYHTCGIQVGNVLSCWGENSSGQLGLGDEDNRQVPTAVLSSAYRTTSATSWSEDPTASVEGLPRDLTSESMSTTTARC